MKKEFEDILKDKMSGFSEKAPDLKESIFKKMDAKTGAPGLEESLRSKMAGYAEKAPDLLSRIFSIRSAGYIFRNRVFLAFRKYGIAALLTTAVFMSLYRAVDREPSEQIISETTVVQQNSEKTTNANGKINGPNVTIKDPSGISAASSEGDITGDAGAPEVSETHFATEDGSQLVANSVSVDHNEGTEVPANPVIESGAGDDVDNTTVVAETENVLDVMKEIADQTEGGLDVELNSDDNVIAAEEEDDLSEVALAENNQDEDLEENNQNQFEDLDNPPIRKYSLEWYYAPSLAKTFFGAGNDALRSARESSETPLYSQYMGMRFNYEISEALEAQVGLEYMERREKVSFTSTKVIEETSITGRKVVIKDPVRPDRVVTVYDTTRSAVTVTSDHNSVNVYKSVTVPVMFRYTVYPVGLPKLGIFVNGGVKLSVWNHQSGYIATADYELQDVNNNVFMKRSVSPSWNLGFGASYRLSDRWSLLGGANVTRSWKPVTSLGYGLEQYNLNSSFIFGAKLNF